MKKKGKSLLLATQKQISGKNINKERKACYLNAHTPMVSFLSSHVFKIDLPPEDSKLYRLGNLGNRYVAIKDHVLLKNYIIVRLIVQCADAIATAIGITTVIATSTAISFYIRFYISLPLIITFTD